MEALLIDEWLRELEHTPIVDEASLTVVRDRIKEVAAGSGASADVAARAVLVATEMGRNHLRHARLGRIAVRPVGRGLHRGLELIAADRGPGLAEVAGALDATPRAVGTLGVGVGAIRRLSSELDVDVRLGEGTCITARLFEDEAPRRREVGVYGRPIPGEPASGDHAAFRRFDDALVVAVCDGLGHGPPAREAASAAVAVFHEHADQAPARILEACHERLTRTRGVVMSACRIAEDAGTLETASIGNVDVQICAPRAVRRFGGSSAVIGGRSARPMKARSERAAFIAGQLLIVTTDGITSKIAVEQDLALLRMHPIVVAQRIVERFARANDDALVLVVR